MKKDEHTNKPSEFDLHHTQGTSPLHIACQKGHLDVVDALLKTLEYEETDKIVNLNLRNQYGHTPLHVACLHGHLDIVNALLMTLENEQQSHKQVDVNLQTQNNSWTPLITSCKNGFLTIVQALTEKGQAKLLIHIFYLIISFYFLLRKKVRLRFCYYFYEKTSV